MKFTDLNLNNPLLNALGDLGYQTPTTIQHKAFPVVMSGRDVVGIAQTGTGKTLGYLLPILRQWEFSKKKETRVLVLVPTRELVVQVVETARKLSAYMSISIEGVYGGGNINMQMAALSQGADIVVGTPGRVMDLIIKSSLQAKHLKKLVIDEVDEMLGLGFRHQLTTVLSMLPQKRQNLMFSATLTDDVEQLINDFFNGPVKIEAAPAGTPLDSISQSAYPAVNFNTKINLLQHLLKDAAFKKVLIFTATKHLADTVFERIEPLFPGVIGVIHSNKSQNNRFETVRLFESGQYRALIATDIIARGLDIAGVSHVINFDVPEEPESYIHRIGRTGRADAQGIAISFVTEKEEPQMKAIEQLMNRQVPVVSMPDEVEVSDVLIRSELPEETMNIQDKLRIKLPDGGGAFHDKLPKNKKVNFHLTRAEKQKLKYGKPKTRGQKPPRKKK
ncbi:MAG: DEAD/DEAH box helicase [Chitinophagales bacterium]